MDDTAAHGTVPSGRVRERRVELIELFYDLIYVYAISRLTLLLEEPEHGVIPASASLASQWGTSPPPTIFRSSSRSHASARCTSSA